MNQNETTPRAVRRVLLVGWDGADWGVIDPLLSAGRMPNLARLVASGNRGALASPSPLLSPVCWTNVATGKRPHQHGVVGFREPRRDSLGSKPVGTHTRKAKAVWTILSENGIRCHVVGWPATHPAEPIRGVMVSDRYAKMMAGVSDPPEFGECIEPAEVRQKLRPLHMHARDVEFDALKQLIPDASQVDQNSDPRLAACAAIVAETSTVHAAATFLVEHDRPWDFAAVCYPGIEQFSRWFMEFHPPRRECVSAREYELYNEVVARAYWFHDLMLGRLLELSGADTTVLLVSPYGYCHDERRPQQSEIGSPELHAAAWHDRRGFAVIAGPGVERGSGELSSANAVDVAPTVLALFGLPRATDMDGRVWSEILSQKNSLPDERVTWESEPDHPSKRTDDFERASEESIRHLLELGYSEPPDEGARRECDVIARTNALNLARSLMEARRAAQAIEVLRPLADSDSASPGNMELLAEAYYRAGRVAEARQLIEQILARGGAAPLAHLGMASLEFAAGRMAQALAHLQRAESESTSAPELQELIGRLYLRMRRLDEAEANFHRALEYDADEVEALEGLAAVHLARACPVEAAEWARRAIVCARDHAPSHYRLGLALLEFGRIEEAIRAFEACLAVDPNALGAHRRLAELYATKLFDPARKRQYESRVQEILLMRRAQGRRSDADE